MTDLQTLVDAFAEEAGLGPVEPDQEGFYHLVVDGEMLVAVGPAADGGIVLLGEVGDVPPEGGEQFGRLLLEAMYGLRETGGATFQIVRGTEKVILRQVMSVARATAALSDHLNAFADIQSEWRRRIADFRPSTEGWEEPAAEDGFMHLERIWS